MRGWVRRAVAVVAVAVVVLARVHRSRALAAVAVVLLGLAVLVGSYNVENLFFRAGVPFTEAAQATGIVLPGLFLLACGLAGRAAARRTVPTVAGTA